jgi:hypothetical protein
VTARTEVWLRPNGRWGWRYRTEAMVLPAALDQDRFDDAVAAARRAYPAVPVVELRPPVLTAKLVVIAAVIVLVAVARRLSR